MRAIPIRNSRPVVRLPTPVVQQAVVQQPVNLKPYGNTVAVTTLADNPFEGNRRVSVVTQASGGMTKPDLRQQSRRLMHDMLPGLGDGPTTVVAAPPAKPAGAMDFLSTALNTGTQLYAAQQAQQVAAAQARAAQAQAAADIASAQNAAAWGALSRPGANMAAHKGITVPLLIVGGAALAIAGFFYFRKGRK